MAEDGTNGMDTSNPQQNDDDRKLFAGGLAQEATEKDITEYFGKFGKVPNNCLQHVKKVFMQLSEPSAAF